jgi:hypothetical protein
MGNIHDEVREQHLKQFPEEEELIRPFLDGFHITWARRRRAYNTEISVYFLRPEPFICELYGFSQEILLAYSPYSVIEPRTIQAIEQILNDDPAKGRVEKLQYFLISESDNVREWINDYMVVNQESRIIVSFSKSELKKNRGDSWFIRNTLNQQLFSRDLFDYRLPLEKDTYFFGRENIVSSFHDAIKRSENRGLFGLRKTGKTSVIFKLDRLIKMDGKIIFLYYDCKIPSIRKLRWYELLQRISSDVCLQI